MAKKNKSINLSSAGKRGKKKHNKKLILINVLATITLLISAVSLTGMFLLDYKPLQAIDDNESNKDLPSVVQSEHKGVSYFLVMGLDESESLTDVIMVVCFDHDNNSASVLQIPRDTFVGTEINTGKTGKVNAVYGHPREGEAKAKALMRCINQYFGLPVDHYVTFTLEGFRNVVDAVGGIEMTLDHRMLVGNSVSDEHYYLGPGTVLLDGEDAESFVRHRNSYAMGDLGRVKAQRDFVIAFAKKLMNMSSGDMLNVAKTCFNEVTSDLSIGDVLDYVNEVRELNFDNISFYSLPGQSKTTTPKGLSQRLSYFSIHKSEYVDLINEHFLPYSEKVTVDDLKITELHSKSEYESGADAYEGGSVTQIEGEN